MENHLIELLLSLLIVSLEAYHAYKLHKTIKALVMLAKQNQNLNTQKNFENDESFNESANLLEDSNK